MFHIRAIEEFLHRCSEATKTTVKYSLIFIIITYMFLWLTHITLVNKI